MANLSAFELPEMPDNPFLAATGGLVILSGIGIVAGASNASAIAAFLQRVLTGSLEIGTPTAAQLFAVAAGVGGAIGNMAAGSNLSKVEMETVPAGWIYPAVLFSGVISALAGIVLVPTGPDHTVAQVMG